METKPWKQQEIYYTKEPQTVSVTKSMTYDIHHRKRKTPLKLECPRKRRLTRKRSLAYSPVPFVLRFFHDFEADGVGEGVDGVLQITVVRDTVPTPAVPFGE